MYPAMPSWRHIVMASCAIAFGEACGSAAPMPVRRAKLQFKSTFANW